MKTESTSGLHAACTRAKTLGSQFGSLCSCRLLCFHESQSLKVTHFQYSAVLIICPTLPTFTLSSYATYTLTSHNSKFIQWNHIVQPSMKDIVTTYSHIHHHSRLKKWEKKNPQLWFGIKKWLIHVINIIFKFFKIRF